MALDAVRQHSIHVSRLIRAHRLACSAVALTLSLVIASAAQSAKGQAAAGRPQPMPNRQKVAGGKMEFDVASIRPAEPGCQIRASFALNFEDETRSPKGALSANLPLAFYIQFACKITLAQAQVDSMLAHLPKWVATDKFVIEAKAEGNPTMDQMRLMMQSLLVDRFRLAMHFDMQETAVLALVVTKPGKLGPRLLPHGDGLACDARWVAPADRGSPSVAPGGFLPDCGTVQAISGPNYTALLGARDITLEHFANYLPLVQDLGRPVVDQTGLTGRFDFSLNWTPDSDAALNFGPGADTGGSDLLEALKNQLGLRLQPEKIPIQVLIIDHVEHPSPN